MQDLRELKSEYVDHKNDSAARREIAARALAAITQFIDGQSPAEENLALPLVDMVGALIAVGDGDLLPMLTPDKKTGGRRHRPRSRRLFEVYPAAAIDILMSDPLKMKRPEAARFVVSELNRHGILASDGF